MQASVSEITLIFATPFDLVSVPVITPEQCIELHDAFNGSEDRRGDNFTFFLRSPSR